MPTTAKYKCARCKKIFNIKGIGNVVYYCDPCRKIKYPPTQPLIQTKKEVIIDKPIIIAITDNFLDDYMIKHFEIYHRDLNFSGGKLLGYFPILGLHHDIVFLTLQYEGDQNNSGFPNNLIVSFSFSTDQWTVLVG